MRRADHSSRGVLPSVVRLSVNEESRRVDQGPLRPSSHESGKKLMKSNNY